MTLAVAFRRSLPSARRSSPRARRPRYRSRKRRKTGSAPGTALAALVDEARQNVVHEEATRNAVSVREIVKKAAEVANADVPENITIDIPLWLQAHYLRNHPEVRPRARAAAGFSKVAVAHAEVPDPTGGFPLALESVHTWMLLHQDLQPSPVTKAAAPKAVVGPNLRISGDSTTPRSESEIRINPANPKQIIAASNNLGNGRQAQFFSGDGGASWGQTTLPLRPGDAFHTDPTLGWTTDGTAWATTIGSTAGGPTSR